MSTKPELTLGKLAECVCKDCCGKGHVSEHVHAGENGPHVFADNPTQTDVRCRTCEGQGILPIGHHAYEIYAFLASEIIKTNELASEVADQLSRTGLDTI